MIEPIVSSPAPIRRPSVSGTFYPADPGELSELVDGLLASAVPPADVVAAVAHGLAGVLVPHAGLLYSGRVAASAWRLSTAPAAPAPSALPTVVLLGTNHSAPWLDGVGVWDTGAWRVPLGDVEVDEELAAAIAALGPPYRVDREAHRSEHSLEVQLPFLRRALPGARIVPLAIGCGRGRRAIDAGERLGALLAKRRGAGAQICLAISTDMAHYPPLAIGAWVTEELGPLIMGLDPAGLVRREAEILDAQPSGLACGMCGIEPTVVGLATLRTMGVVSGIRLAAATSADAGGSPGRTVGYLAAAFPG